jgi:hypothetical protein
MFCQLGISQNKMQQDSINRMINQINWNSFQISTNHFSKLVPNECLISLSKHKDKKTIVKLLRNINISNKTVAIHVVLTNIFELNKGIFLYNYEYDKNSRVKNIKYTYNNLNWDSSVDVVNYHISKKEIRKVEKYWEKIIYNKFGEFSNEN